MIYLVGDLQGCCDAFERLLAHIGFSPSRDRLYLLGDLVNRGPCSLATLERVAGLGDAAHSLLGNHDLNLLAVAHGLRRPGRQDTLDDILASPRLDHWIDWLRHQPLARHDHGWLMVHAGVPPQWTLAQTLERAAEVQAILRGPDHARWLGAMYGDEPARWSDDLPDEARWRFTINALTRLRFVRADGSLSLKETGATAGAGLVPWFDAPGRRTAGVPIACGHWSTLGLVQRPDLLALDTGCVWGGALSAARLDPAAPTRPEILSIPCAQAQAPQ